MSELPEGWAIAPIGDLVTLNPKNQTDDDTQAAFIPMNLLGKDYRSVPIFETRRWSEIKSGYVHFQNGDVLLAKITPCFENGKAGIVQALPGGLGAGSTEYFVCRAYPGSLSPKYLLAFLKTPSFLSDGALQMTGSVGHKRVPKEYLVGTALPLPPLSEQKRIADKLDTLLARIDACRSRLDRLPLVIKQFRQSVLAAATSGRLTEEWRLEQGYSLEDWNIKSLGDLVRESANGLSKRQANAGTETVVLRLADFKNSERVRGNERTIKLDDRELAKYGLTAGDLLVVRVNGSRDLTGKFIKYESRGGEAEAYCDHFIRLRLDTQVIAPQFALFVANSGLGRTYVESVLVTSAGQNTISKTPLFGLSIALPALGEQMEIIRRVEVLFALADRLEARVATARSRVDTLTPATLAKAFRGELVPQDPNDEPASVLLERIRAERAAVGDSRPRTRRTAKDASLR